MARKLTRNSAFHRTDLATAGISRASAGGGSIIAE
jgi:hypothetical protein